MHEKKIISLLMFSLVFILTFKISQALVVTIQPPRMILRMNVTPNITATKEAFLYVKNYNNVTVDISLEPTQNYVDIIELEDNSFVLEPNETRKVNFDVQIDQPGQYYGAIEVKFSSNSGLPGVVMPSEIIIFANELASTDENNSNENSNPDQLNIFIILTLVVIVLVVFAIIQKFKT